MMSHNKKTPHEMVTEFFTAFHMDFPAERSITPSLDHLSKERIDLRMDLIFEEFSELVEAVYGDKSARTLKSIWDQVKNDDEENRDIVETADALTDIVVVVENLALDACIPSDDVFAEVHRANMSKLDTNGEPIISDGTDGFPKGKILKGPNYSPPNVKEVLFGNTDSE